MPQSYDSSFIVDANVLIDYCDSDPIILSLLSQNIGNVYLGRATFEKVDQLTIADANRLYLTIITPDLATALAAAKKRSSLAYDDHETLLLAMGNDWICISNDKVLRRECEREKVSTLWGLEPMKILVERRLLSARRALKTAENISLNNPQFITREILDRFNLQIMNLHK